ncbi:MAG: peptidoglycan DD-metalloendopeptidase family protein [Clostridia bacterium]|nr:peptidoglycan DD-metalloendopeptidase family protein [Clostridia bacterium]MBO5321709.1 peptidoglycan DD-metalloendopeptidase family protein [Clostridia bacterium]
MAKYKNPVLRKGGHKVTSPFGMRTIWGKKQMHNGIDLVGEGATLDYIIAFADGVVKISKYSLTAGEYVSLYHGNGNYTRYLHMKKGSRTVKAGDKVLKGQVLGYMGATGNVTGAHLHFDVNVNGKYVDPAPYLEGVKEFENTPNKVKDWQLAAIADGFKFPKYGADGKWGAECESVAKKAVCKKRVTYKYKSLTKIVQRAVGVTVDGKFGKNTRTAVINWQKLVGLTPDGCVGPESWKKLLGVK